MKSSEAMRKARELIDDKRVRYVCIALCWSGGENTKAAYRLRKALSINGIETTLEHYLFSKHPTFKEYEAVTHWGIFKEAMREYRLAWIDWMIEGYEAAGD